MLLLVPLSLAGTLPVTAVSASSTYPKENGVSYSADYVVDGRVTTFWVEGERASGLGSWVQLELGEAKMVRGVRLWNGSWASTDFWTRHNRMRDIEVQLSDGTKLPFTLKDEQAPATLIFPKPVATTFVKIKLKSVYAGSTFGDTPLSEVQVLDEAPEPALSAKASTTYPADATASYAAANVLDGFPDTMWCEGDKKDGNGQWILVDLGASSPLTTLHLRNGNASSVEDNAAANQASAVTLTFDDGASEALSLAATSELQTLSFPSHTTRTVKVTVTGVTAGSEYPDLCFSEIGFE